MATTKIWSVKRTVKKAIDYIIDEEKTQSQMLVSGYEVLPQTADLEFAMTANLAEDINGNRNKIGGSNILAYHMEQSFSKKDKITPEQAHAIGKKWADRILQGKHEYVIATHIDKEHIHNHVIFNSTSFETLNKFRTEPYKTAQKLRDISDKLCLEQGLFIVENPKGTGKKAYEYMQRKAGNSWKAKIENAINSVIPQVADYQEFIESLAGLGITIKEGKYLTYEIEGSKNRVRANGKGLSLEYSKEAILDRIHSENLDGLKHITITKKLIVMERERDYFTRIPYTRYFVAFNKDVSSWYLNGNTLSTFIYPGNEYTLYDKNGNIIKKVTGQELSAYYNVKETEIEKEHNTRVVKRVRGLTRESSSDIVSLNYKAAALTKKDRISNIKEISMALHTMRKENITSHSELLQRVADLKEQIEYFKNNELQSINRESSEVVKTLNQISTYYKYESQVNSIRSAHDSKGGALERKFKDILQEFDFAKSELEKKGIVPSISLLDKYKNVYANIVAKKTEIQNNISELEKCRDRLENVDRVIRDVSEKQTEGKQLKPKERGHER